MTSRTQTADYAVAHPPAILAPFALTVLDVVAEFPHCVGFTLACSHCGARQFRIFSRPITVPDPSPYFGLAPGDEFKRPPHDLQCAGCSSLTQVFDPRRHGYDAILNAWSGYECGDDAGVAAAGVFEVWVSLAFNCEWEEIKGQADEAGVSVSDLFDWFSLTGKQVDGDAEILFHYECA